MRSMPMSRMMVWSIAGAAMGKDMGWAEHGRRYWLYVIRY
jgi:hypothetical protein